MLDRVLNSQGDYVSDDAGGYEMTHTAMTAVQHQIYTELNGWVGDPDAGLDFSLLPTKDTELHMDRYVEAIRTCLRPLEEAGRVTEISISHERDIYKRRQVLGTMRDVQAGESLTLIEPAPGGV